MPIEVEFLNVPLTGIIGSGETGVYYIAHAPSTGPNGAYDIAIDPMDGPAQEYNKDFGVTHLSPGSTTGAITINLADSDIKDVVNNYVAHGVTGVLILRAVYNYEP